MTKILLWPIALLSFGLPMHGGITVFFPDYARFWKEVLLLMLFVMALPAVFGFLKDFYRLFTSKSIDKSTFKSWSLTPLFWAFLFLAWAGILTVFTSDLHTALVAYRYLGLGFFAFGLCFLLCKNTAESVKNGDKERFEVLHIFCTFLILGTTFSVLFGLWAQFLGGFKIVETFYASTISSWVPGQTLPLYHEAGGVIRMQGLASGPIELAHLCLLSLIALGFLSQKWPKWAQILVALILVVGIYFTASRAVELVLLLGVLFYFVRPFWPRIKPFFTEEIILLGLIGVLVFLGGAKLVLTSDWAKNDSWLNQSVESRGGTMDHFTRPVEAIKSGSQTLLSGQLGQWGPAARAKNLREINDDKAPIAENVFADWWVQLGILGFLFGIAFLVACLYQFIKQSRSLGIALLAAFFIPMNLATIFDMTPISLTFFIFLGLLVASPSTSK